MKETKGPFDIKSSEKENCLYVHDIEEKCVWKVTQEADDQHKITKWLSTEYLPFTLSVSSGGQLLVVGRRTSTLLIYRSDAELLRLVQLPADIKYPLHAVETSFGNYIILHFSRPTGTDDIDGSWSRGRTDQEMVWVVTELARDGEIVIRRFISSNETQEMKYPGYLSLDSDDRVFLTDIRNGFVILLDNDLKWNRILCPSKEEKIEARIRKARQLCYDEEKRQLLVAIVGDIVKIYTLS